MNYENDEQIYLRDVRLRKNYFTILRGIAAFIFR